VVLDASKDDGLEVYAEEIKSIQSSEFSTIIILK
jgi:hypothetical protein